MMLVLIFLLTGIVIVPCISVRVQRSLNMRRLLTIVVSLNFLLLTLSVPEGKISLLYKLPALYRHCKATGCLNIYRPDHLIHVDKFFDNHLFRNTRRSSQSFQFHLQHVVAHLVYSNIAIATPVFWITPKGCVKTNCLHSRFIAHIFHPPNP